MSSKRYGDQKKEWEIIVASMAANASEIPQADIPRAALERMIVEVNDVLVEQSLHRATKQQLSKRLRRLFVDGEKLASVLRAIAKQHYGRDNDKLVEFGVQPARRVSRKSNSPESPPTPGGIGEVTLLDPPAGE